MEEFCNTIIGHLIFEYEVIIHWGDSHEKSVETFNMQKHHLSSSYD
jgi:hypothetical protein